MKKCKLSKWLIPLIAATCLLTWTANGQELQTQFRDNLKPASLRKLFPTTSMIEGFLSRIRITALPQNLNKFQANDNTPDSTNIGLSVDVFHF